MTTVATIVEVRGAGYSPGEILELYPYLEPTNINEALTYTASSAEETEMPMQIE